MFYCVLLVGLMTLITGLLNHSPFNLGILVVVSAFFFSMFSVYGNRVASIGSAVLLVMALRMADVQPVNLVLRDTLLVTAGGIWYMAIDGFLYTGTFQAYPAGFGRMYSRNSPIPPIQIGNV